LPTDFAERYTEREQYFAVRHEVLHHKRGDVAANAAGLVLLSFHWFNPIAHLAYRAFRADQEAACDATVLCNASDQDRADYGQALFKSAIGPAPLFACRISAAKGVKARLEHIVNARDTAHLHDTGSALACVAIIAGLGLTATTFAPAGRPVSRPQLAFITQPEGQEIYVKPRHLVKQAEAKPQSVVADDIIVRTSALIEQSTVPSQKSLNDLKQTINVAPAPKLAIAAANGPVVNSLLSKPEGDAAKVPANTAQAAPVALAGMQCPARGTIIATQQIVVSDDQQMAFTMRFCVPEGLSPEDQRDAVLAGLANTRTKVVEDARLPEPTRAVLLSAIDTQIHTMRGQEI
jgi:bla regulator protein blaR1